MDDAAGRMEREARREQATAEAEGRQLHLASRTLTDVAWEAMQRGDRLRVSWPGGELAGVVSAAVGDLVVIRTEVGAAGINTATVTSIEAVSGDSEHGAVGDRTVESFVAWCRMLVGQPARISVTGGRTVEGTLAAVAPDHLLIRLRGGGEVAVARTRVAVVSVAGEAFFAL